MSLTDIDEEAAALADEFAFLDDWEARYGHVIDLGRSLPALPESARTEANRVRGCASQVWLTVDQDPDGSLRFAADSDAHIVRGLIAILLRLYDGRAPEAIRAFDPEALFRTLGLNEALSQQRANGLRAMVARIRAAAEAA